MFGNAILYSNIELMSASADKGCKNDSLCQWNHRRYYDGQCGDRCGRAWLQCESIGRYGYAASRYR